MKTLKKLLIATMCIFTMNSFAADVTVNANFIKEIGNLKVERITRTPLLAYVKNSDANFNILKKYGYVDRKSNGRISLSANSTYNGQCAGLIQTTSNAGLVSTWIKGAEITHLTPKFTPIATFYGYDNEGKQTKYSNYSQYSHVAYFLGIDGDRGIYVLDQNHNGTGSNPVGELHIRFIPYSGNHQLNAGNYYVISK